MVFMTMGFACEEKREQHEREKEEREKESQILIKKGDTIKEHYLKIQSCYSKLLEHSHQRC